MFYYGCLFPIFSAFWSPKLILSKNNKVLALCFQNILYDSIPQERCDEISS